MEQHRYPDTAKELAQKRRGLAPEIHGTFRAFGQRVFADGALAEKTKQLIAVAVAHVTQCPYCIRHTELATQKGATGCNYCVSIIVAVTIWRGLSTSAAACLRTFRLHQTCGRKSHPAARPHT